MSLHANGLEISVSWSAVTASQLITKASCYIHLVPFAKPCRMSSSYIIAPEHALDCCNIQQEEKTLTTACDFLCRVLWYISCRRTHAAGWRYAWVLLLREFE